MTEDSDYPSPEESFLATVLVWKEEKQDMADEGKWASVPLEIWGLIETKQLEYQKCLLKTFFSLQ